MNTPEEVARAREIITEYMDLLHAGLVHQMGHGVIALGCNDICPDSIVLLCGSAVLDRFNALRDELQLLRQGVAEAALEIDRLKRGH